MKNLAGIPLRLLLKPFQQERFIKNVDRNECPGQRHNLVPKQIYRLWHLLDDYGFIDFGTSICGAWLTEKGSEVYAQLMRNDYASAHAALFSVKKYLPLQANRTFYVVIDASTDLRSADIIKRNVGLALFVAHPQPSFYILYQNTSTDRKFTVTHWMPLDAVLTLEKRSCVII